MTDIDTVTQMFDGDGLDGFGHDEKSKVIVEGDWIDDGKYSHTFSVVEYKGKTYGISQSRSGSYYTDYDYNDPEIYEVVKREVPVIKTHWDKVK